MNLLNRGDKGGLRFEDLLEIRPGGFKDTVATLSVLSPFLAATPLFSGWVYAASVLMGTAGALYWASRLNETRTSPLLSSQFYIHNSEFEKIGEDQEKICLGVKVEDGEPFEVAYNSIVRHMSITGQSGYGKTVFLEYMIMQHVAKGGGVLFLDGKIDAENKERMKKIAAWAGRLQDTYIVDMGYADESNTFNPILDQEPDEAASALVSMIPSSENNPGSDFYRSETTMGLTALLSAIKATGRAYCIGDLAVLLQSASALEELYNLIPDDQSKVKAQYALFLDKFRLPSKGGEPGAIDVKKIKDVFGGMAGRLHGLSQGNIGEITSDYTPDVMLDEIILGNKVLYVALETMNKQEAALSFAKILIGSLRSSIGRIQRLPKARRPNPPFLVIMDEAGSYLTPAITRAFEQARSAGVAMVPAFQTFSSLEAVDVNLKKGVFGSTEINIFFSIGEVETAEEAAELVDKEKKKQRTIAFSTSGGKTKMPGVEALPVGESETTSYSYSEREVEEYRVPTKVFKELDKGEAIILYEKNKVFHVRVPMVDLDGIDLGKEATTPYKPIAKPKREGLNFHKKEKIAELVGFESGEEF